VNASLPRIALVYPVPIPYTFPVLRRIVSAGEVDLTVFYARRTLPGREPVQNEHDLDFPHHFLPDRGRVRVGVDVHEIDFNPTLPGELERRRVALVIVSGFVQPTALLGIGWARIRRRRYGIMSESHALRSRGASRRLLRRTLIGPVVRGAAVLYPTGRLAAAELQRLGGRDDRTVLFPHVPDPALFHAEGRAAARVELRRAIGGPEDVPVAIYVGRLVESKGVKALIAAQRRVHAATGARLAVVGGGPLATPLRSTAPSGVSFLGPRQPAEVAALLRGADLAVVPSLDEPWGTVVLEALACGCPVVASDRVAAAVEVLPTFGAGELFPGGDVERLAEVLEELLSDRARRARLGEGAARAAAAYTPERAAAAFLDGVRIAFPDGGER
jgi:glycosyltransferase involved in cell wall biosynthesis